VGCAPAQVFLPLSQTPVCRWQQYFTSKLSNLGLHQIFRRSTIIILFSHRRIARATSALRSELRQQRPEVHLVELDGDLRTKVLSIEAKLLSRSAKRSGCCCEIFDFLVERHFATDLPQTEIECQNFLQIDASQVTYDIARQRGWLTLVQDSRRVWHSEWILGDQARVLNAQNRPDRLPTLEEVRDAWWLHRIRDWEYRFLEMRKTAPVVDTSIGFEKTTVARRGRGYAANAKDHRKVCDAVSKVGDDWSARLPELCRHLQTLGAEFPLDWKNPHSVQCWDTVADKVQDDSRLQERVRAYVKYRITWLQKNLATQGVS
jgi:hypothetical protein